MNICGVRVDNAEGCLSLEDNSSRAGDAEATKDGGEEEEEFYFYIWTFLDERPTMKATRTLDAGWSTNVEQRGRKQPT